MNNRCVVLLSGGLDSSTVLSIALSGGCKAYALSFDYNQRHRIELDAARRVASSAGVERHLVVKFDLHDVAVSALTSDIEVPKVEGEYWEAGNAAPAAGEASAQSAIPVTYVPARNTIFLSFALAWAEVLQAEQIFIGANAIDYSGYPDCRREYIEAYETMANLATKASVEGLLRFRIRAPLIAMKKSDIIRKGTELGVDYSLTWSCYDPHEEAGSHGGGAVYRPCGRCDSCVLRRKGFAEAGIPDPLVR